MSTHVHTCPSCHEDVPCLWLTCAIEPELSGPGEPARGFYVRCDACDARATPYVRDVRRERWDGDWRSGDWRWVVTLPHYGGGRLAAACTSMEAAHAAARLLAGLCSRVVLRGAS